MYKKNEIVINGKKLNFIQRWFFNTKMDLIDKIFVKHQ